MRRGVWDVYLSPIQPEFPIKVTVNKAEAQDAAREALRRAGLQQGFTASDKRQYDAETKRLAAMQVAQARAAVQNALAQQRFLLLYLRTTIMVSRQRKQITRLFPITTRFWGKLLG